MEEQKAVTGHTKEAKLIPVFRLGEEVSPAVRKFFRQRGWQEASEHDPNWNVWWRDRSFLRVVHNALGPTQRLNHMQNTMGITRKDHLGRTMRHLRATYGPDYDLVPLTFLVPKEISEFKAYYNSLRTSSSSSSPAVWIFKPAAERRGIGIYLFRELGELRMDIEEATLAAARISPDTLTPAAGAGVIQRYIHQPYLIFGYKFDLRLYVLLTSCWPLKCFVHKRGLVRFSTQKYNLDKLDNNFSHLTNSTINKKSPTLHLPKEFGKGCKWTLEQLFTYLRDQGHDTQRLWQRIRRLVLLTVLPLVGAVPLDPLCWELLGFDVLLDAELRPWLLEVNRSPAMAVTCTEDQNTKTPMLHDMFNILELDERVFATTPSSGAGGSVECEEEVEVPAVMITAPAAKRPRTRASVAATASTAPSAPTPTAPLRRKRPSPASLKTPQMRDVSRTELSARAGEFELLCPFNAVTEAACVSLSKLPMGGASDAKTQAAAKEFHDTVFAQLATRDALQLFGPSAAAPAPASASASAAEAPASTPLAAAASDTAAVVGAAPS